MSKQDTYLIRTMRVLKRVMSLPLEDVFTVGGTAISWRLTKQTLVSTSSNHAEILAPHETTWEYFWLRAVVGHIRRQRNMHRIAQEGLHQKRQH